MCEKNYILYLIKLLNKIAIITGEKVLSSGINRIALRLEPCRTLMPASLLLPTCFQGHDLLAVSLQHEAQGRPLLSEWEEESRALIKTLLQKLLTILYLKNHLSLTLRIYLSQN